MCWKCVGNVLEMCWKCPRLCARNVLEMSKAMGWKWVGTLDKPQSPRKRSSIATFMFIRYHSYGLYQYCPASATRPPHRFHQPCTVSTLVPASISETQQSTTAQTSQQLRVYRKTRPREVSVWHVCSLSHIRVRRNLQWVRHDKAKGFLTIRLSYRTRCLRNLLLDRCHQWL
jgi:hypothetical protein